MLAFCLHSVPIKTKQMKYFLNFAKKKDRNSDWVILEMFWILVGFDLI